MEHALYRAKLQETTGKPVDPAYTNLIMEVCQREAEEEEERQRQKAVARAKAEAEAAEAARLKAEEEGVEDVGQGEGGSEGTATAPEPSFVSPETAAVVTGKGEAEADAGGDDNKGAGRRRRRRWGASLDEEARADAQALQAVLRASGQPVVPPMAGPFAAPTSALQPHSVFPTPTSLPATPAPQLGSATAAVAAATASSTEPEPAQQWPVGGLVGTAVPDAGASSAPRKRKRRFDDAPAHVVALAAAGGVGSAVAGQEENPEALAAEAMSSSSTWPTHQTHLLMQQIIIASIIPCSTTRWRSATAPPCDLCVHSTPPCPVSLPHSHLGISSASGRAAARTEGDAVFGRAHQGDAGTRGNVYMSAHSRPPNIHPRARRHPRCMRTDTTSAV